MQRRRQYRELHDVLMWRVFQTVIVVAVMCANVYYKLTPNPYAAGFIGLMIALGFTWLLSKSIDLLRYRRRRQAARQ